MSEKRVPFCGDCRAVHMLHCADFVRCGNVVWPDDPDYEEKKRAMLAHVQKVRLAATPPSGEMEG